MLSDEKIQEIEGADRDSVTWNQFCTTYFPERNFTFWEWFYHVIKLVVFLDKIWTKNLVVGFINRETASQTLLHCGEGTFLLRFSDSVLGNKNQKHTRCCLTRNTFLFSLLQVA